MDLIWYFRKDAIISKIDVGFISIAQQANNVGKIFSDAYDQDTKKTTFTDIQFEKWVWNDKVTQ